MSPLERDALDVEREFVDMADGAEFDSLALKSVAICQTEIDAIRTVLAILAEEPRP